MVFILGTDEAGYGPNLGPLCIGASAWQLPDELAGSCLYELLAGAVVREPVASKETKQEARDPSCWQPAIADLKQLYKAGGSLELLERGVLLALACLDRLPRTWRDIWPALDAAATEQIDGQPWHDGFDEPLPLHANVAELQQVAARFIACCQKAAVNIVDLQAAVLFPAAFNTAVERCNNKAEVLSLTTLHLARRILESLPAGRAIVFCDKHGGRMRYAALLQHIFPEELVLVRLESAILGVYEVRHAGRAIEFRFQPKGERHLPTALASMTAKYLREIAMRPFNAFWQRHIPDLRATAGYPTDAQRFFAAIGPTRLRLKIANDLVWRTR